MEIQSKYMEKIFKIENDTIVYSNSYLATIDRRKLKKIKRKKYVVEYDKSLYTCGVVLDHIYATYIISNINCDMIYYIEKRFQKSIRRNIIKINIDCISCIIRKISYYFIFDSRICFFKWKLVNEN